jgi:formate hydrogenlyase transcriptional activator
MACSLPDNPSKSNQPGCDGCPIRWWLLPGGSPVIQPLMPTEAAAHCPTRHERACIVEETISTVLTTLEVEVVVDRTARLLRRHFGLTRVGLMRVIPDDPRQAEVLLVDDPQHPVPAPGTRVALEGTAAGRAIETGRTQLLEELDPAAPRVAEEETLGRYGYGALACFPLISEGRVLGTLEIAHPPRCGLLQSCIQVAEKVAQLIAVALANSLLMEEVRRLNRLLEHENTYLKQQIRESAAGYIAESPVMREVMEKVRLVAPSDSTVLIRGETGTGKEGLARLVHELSKRKEGPFVVVNLGAIPETLVESELFGHEKGAFTGASRRKVGRFEQASGGTIFLDEVGDAPPPVQVKLLRALQERQIERVGGGAPISVDVRVVAATNRALERMIETGAFRSDLYYRLSTFPIHLAPLRERPEDLRPLVEHLLEKHAARMHRRPPAVPDEAWRALATHRWPGNIRELENFLERALILCPDSPLTLTELPVGQPASAPPAHPAGGGQVRPFDQVVRETLVRALEAAGGKIYGEDGAAEQLGLKPTTLQGKLKKYGLR